MEDPTNFLHKIDVFQNYNKALNRIIPSTGQSEVKPGETTIFTVPIGTFDWDTYRVQYDFTTAGDANHVVGMPQFTPCLIEQLDIYVNGINIQHIPYYGFVYKLMKDYSISFEEALQRVGTNPDPSVYSTMTEEGVVTKYARHIPTASTPVNQFTDEYVIDDWIGFIGTCKPRIWNTNICGTMEIHIKWASAAVLWGTAGSTFDYTISNLYGYIDKIDWKEKGYYEYIEKQLSSDGGFKIPYKNYRVHIGTALADKKESTTRFTESTQSLDKIMLTFFHGAKNTNSLLQLGTPANVIPTFAITAANLAQDPPTVLNTALNNITDGDVAPSEFIYPVLKTKNDPNLLNTSQYFRRNGLGMRGAKVQFEINSQDIPSFGLSLLSQYEETLKAFELNDADMGKINPGLTDINRWEKDFYCCALSTSHINDKRPDFLISGKDTMSTSMNICAKVVSGRTPDNAQACTPVIITEMSAILIVRSGREVSVVF